MENDFGILALKEKRMTDAIRSLQNRIKIRLRNKKIRTPKKIIIGNHEIIIEDCFWESYDTVVVILNCNIIHRVHQHGVRVSIRGLKPVNMYYYEPGRKSDYLPVNDEIIKSIVHLTLNELNNILPIYPLVHSHFRKK